MRQAFSLLIVLFCALYAVDARVALSYSGPRCPADITIAHGQLNSNAAFCMEYGLWSYGCPVKCDSGYYSSLQYPMLSCTNGTWSSIECLPMASPQAKYCQQLLLPWGDRYSGIWREQTPIGTAAGVTSADDCQKTCTQTSNCFAALFKLDQNTNTPLCTLYSEVGDGMYRCPVGVTCSNYQCTDPTARSSTIASGNRNQGTVIQTGPTLSFSNCQRQCALNSACKAADYKLDKKTQKSTCTLYSQTGPAIAQCDARAFACLAIDLVIKFVGATDSPTNAGSPATHPPTAAPRDDPTPATASPSHDASTGSAKVLPNNEEASSSGSSSSSMLPIVVGAVVVIGGAGAAFWFWKKRQASAAGGATGTTAKPPPVSTTEMQPRVSSAPKCSSPSAKPVRAVSPNADNGGVTA